MATEKSRPVSIVLAGIGGYGYYYLKTILQEFPDGEIELLAVVDPKPERSNLHRELIKRAIPIFTSLEDFYDADNAADLAVISSPIHHHVRQSCLALKHGSNVLCEKPLGVTIQDVHELIRIRDETEKWVMTAYQWSYSCAIQSLKKDILKGIFGKPLRLKTLCFWPRDMEYYRRNSWAGRQQDAKGNWVLDSPANNAMAHFLHNLFYVAGEKTDCSAAPAKLAAEVYRAYPIENFDTVACRIITTNDVELLFYATHASGYDKERGPMFNFEFEEANVTLAEDKSEIIAITKSGRKINYGSPDADHQFLKLFEAVKTVHNGKPVICGPEAAAAQTLCINGIQDSNPLIADFPESIILRNENRDRLAVKGLEETLLHCYQKWILPYEARANWARQSQEINLINYQYFPGGKLPEKG